MLGGVGDEAFCTTVDMTGSVGVLVRRGDTVVYTSLQGTDAFTDAEMVGTLDGLVSVNRAACDRSAEPRAALS